MSAATGATGKVTAQKFETDRSPLLWLIEREVLRFLNIWQYTIVGPVLSTSLFVIVFGTVLNQHVSAIGGVPYGQFIVPGLFAQAIVTVGFINGTTSLFEARRDRYIHDVFASPLRWWEINAALVAGGVVRGVIVGAGVLVIALPLSHIHGIADPLLFAAGTIGVLLVAAQVGVIAGSLASSLDHLYAMESVVVLPLGFLGGVFYSVDQLPAPWDQASLINPVFWLVQVERAGLLGHADVGAGAALAVVWTMAIGLSAWSAVLFGAERLKP